MDVIEFSGLKIIHKKRAYQRSVNLLVKENGNIVLTSGKTVHTAYLNKILLNRERWLHETLQAVHKKRRIHIKKKFTQGESFLFRGKPLFLNITLVKTRGVRFSQDGVNLNIFLSEAKKLQFMNDDSGFLSALQKYYKECAHELLPFKFDQWSVETTLKANELRLKTLSSTWGLCSNKGTVTLSWKLIAAPDYCIDYVIVHELAHLKQHNHSKKFWHIVYKHFPEADKAQEWLKANHIELDFLNKKSALFGMN